MSDPARPDPTATSMEPAADPASVELDETAGASDAGAGVAITATPDVSTQHLVGVSFDKLTRADEVLLVLVHLQMEGQIQLADAVVVAKTPDERVHVRQTVDITTGRGALSGSLWGMLVGAVMGGPAFPIGIVAGAAAGALAARLVDIGLDDHWVKEVGHWLDPGTSALLLLVGDDMRPTVIRELERFEGRVIYCTFPDAVREELERALQDQRGA